MLIQTYYLIVGGKNARTDTTSLAQPAGVLGEQLLTDLLKPLIM